MDALHAVELDVDVADGPETSVIGGLGGRLGERGDRVGHAGTTCSASTTQTW